MIFRLIRPGQTLRERRSAATNAGDLESSGADVANSAEYRCCLCLHVKTGTLLLGLWQAWVQLFVVSFLLAVLINPGIVGCIGGRFAGPTTPSAAAASSDIALQPQHPRVATSGPVAEASVDLAGVASNSGEQQQHLGEERRVTIGSIDRYRLRRQDHALMLLIGIVSLLLAMLLVVGTLRERAKYLMPYFCMQLFDFVINCLTVVGYFSYLPDAKTYLSGHRWPHGAAVRRFLLGLDDATLGFVMLVACMLYLMAKAYLLGMVWACYKFLLRKEAGRLRAIGGSAIAAASAEYIDDDDPAVQAAVAASVADCHPLLMPVPPKYEDALKQPANLNAPPPYYPGAYAAAGAPELSEEDDDY